MSTMTGKDINALALTCGFIGRQAQTIAAIALAESGGNTTAHNSKPPDDSYGLTQINMIGSLGVARLKQFGLSKKTDLFDPAVNLKAANAIFKSSGFEAWTTYKNSKYKDHINDVGSDNSPVGNVVQGVEDSSQFAGLSNAIASVGNNVFKTGANFAGIVVAVVLVIVGVAILLLNSDTAKSAVRTVAGVASPGTKVQGAAKLFGKVASK